MRYYSERLEYYEKKRGRKEDLSAKNADTKLIRMNQQSLYVIRCMESTLQRVIV